MIGAFIARMVRAPGGLGALAPVLLAAAFVALASAPARAQVTCTASFSPLAFGSVNALQGNAVDSAGALSVSCSGFQGNADRVRICFTMGAGSYPLSGSLRQLGSGANRALMQIYSDAARTLVWDSSLANAVSVILTRDAPSTVVPVYGRVIGGQQNAPPGFYSTTMNAALHQAIYNGQPPSCASIASQSALSFAVNADLPSSCSATATNLNFGELSNFAASLDATSTINVLCTNTTPYHVRLDGGTSGSGVTQRAMALGANKINYGLFRDAARTQNWGATDGVDTVTGTGTTSSVGHTVHGRIPPQPRKPQGGYSDTIVVTISFL
jgi:spore coat protein U-like protein